MSTGINIDKSIKVVDETTPITDSASQLTFTGAGVTATGSGGNVTINIPGGSTGTVTNVTGVSPIASSGGNTPAISISDAAANGTTKGAATFTASDFSDNGSGVISLDYVNGQKASASQDGFLSSSDWTTFNGKQNQLNGTGFVKASGTTITYDNSTYLTSAITSLNGLTASTQTFATPGTTGTAPNWNSATSVHTLNIPSANASGVTAGLISNTEFTTFNNKVSTGAITGSGLTMATSRLLGRTTAGTAGVEEISIGTGLTLSGGTLSSTGGGITVGTTAVTSGTDGRVFFQAGGVVQQDGAFNWDNTNKRLGIGANATSPSAALYIRTNLTSANDVLDIQNGQYGNPLFRIRDMSTASPIANFFFSGLIFGGNSGATRRFDLGGYGLGASFGDSSVNAVWENNQGNVGDGQGTSVIAVSSNLYVNLQTTKKYKFEAVTGNFGIGNVGSLGARLDVRAQGALSTDIAFRVRNSADTANLTNINGNGGFKIGLDNAYHISLDPTSPSLRGQNGATVAWQLSPWSGEHSWLTNNPNNQNLIGIGTTSPSDKLHIYNIANDYRIRIAVAASNPADESCGIRFTTTWAGTSFGVDAANLVVRTKGTSSSTTQRTALEFRMNALGTSALRASLTSQSNFLLQSPTEDTNDIGVIYIPNGTAPTSSITDGYKQYSADITAGNAAPHFRTENGAIVKVYQETTGVGASTLVSGVGTPLTDTDTFDGYTLKQIVKALRNQGLLA